VRIGGGGEGVLPAHIVLVAAFPSAVPMWTDRSIAYRANSLNESYRPCALPSPVPYARSRRADQGLGQVGTPLRNEVQNSSDDGQGAALPVGREFNAQGRDLSQPRAAPVGHPAGVHSLGAHSLGP